MIVKKLAVPLINDKILQQAEHCYIATSAISESGFEFIRSRIQPKCKMDIVISLDEPTTPVVLDKIIRDYQGRINLQLYTRNSLHANLYIFDLPFRKSVAFVGSGSLSVEGFKDHEELFWKITGAKEIESLMSWYTSYFQFSVPLTEEIVRGYELLYPEIKQRDIHSSKEKAALFSLHASSFQWEAVKFKNQFFKKEDYLVLSHENAPFDNASLRLLRMALRDKLLKLQEMISDGLKSLKLESIEETAAGVDPQQYPSGRISSMWLNFRKRGDDGTMVVFQVGPGQKDFLVRCCIAGGNAAKGRRQDWQRKMDDTKYRTEWYAMVSSLLNGYFMEVSGVKKAFESMSQDSALSDFIKTDSAGHFEIIFEKRFSPGDVAISEEAIMKTTLDEFARLLRASQDW